MSHPFSEPGQYPVTINVTDGQDLRKVTQWVNVREDLDPVAAVGEEHVGAFVGQPVTLDGSPSLPADADSYTWDFGDGSTGTGAVVSHVYSTIGPKSPALTVTVGYRTDTITTNDTVFPPPAPDTRMLVPVSTGAPPPTD